MQFLFNSVDVFCARDLKNGVLNGLLLAANEDFLNLIKRHGYIPSKRISKNRLKILLNDESVTAYEKLSQAHKDRVLEKLGEMANELGWKRVEIKIKNQALIFTKV